MRLRNSSCGRDGHGHLDLLGLPLLPRAAVEPDFAVVVPRLALHAVDGLEDGAEADAVRAVRVGQVAGGVDLVRLDLLQQVHDDLDVLLAERLLAHAAGLVERHVQEVQLLIRNAAVAAGGAGFAAADQALDLLHLFGVDLAGLLLLEEVLDVLFDLLGLLAVDAEHFVEVGGEVGEADRIGIEHRDVAGGLVRDVNLVALVDEADAACRPWRSHRHPGAGEKIEHALGEDLVAAGGRGRRAAWPRAACRPASR